METVVVCGGPGCAGGGSRRRRSRRDMPAPEGDTFMARYAKAQRDGTIR